MPLALSIAAVIAAAGSPVFAQHPANREYAALAPMAGAKPLAPLFDQPLTDTSVAVGPGGVYYLTGSAGGREGAIFSPTITLWRSTGMKEWSKLCEITLDGTKGRSPEVRYLKGAFWLTYGREGGGTDLIRFDSLDLSASSFRSARITADGEDPSLFLDDDGALYWVMGKGQVARLKSDPLAGLDETPAQIEITPQATELQKDPSKTVGARGAFLEKIRGRYCLFAADRPVRKGFGRIGTPGGANDTYVASSGNLYRSYGRRYIGFPHAGHSSLFQDRAGRWYATMFGNDRTAPFRTSAGMMPLEVVDTGEDLILKPAWPDAATRGQQAEQPRTHEFSR
ncbi:MAG: family 43 glycosylhydrolase [Candidatus Sumerlaeota bacterium]|nr:family 43 glycosylhydrolase [Candidatus Sumerlaeota bacterium]